MCLCGEMMGSPTDDCGGEAGENLASRHSLRNDPSQEEGCRTAIPPSSVARSSLERQWLRGKGTTWEGQEAEAHLDFAVIWNI